MPQFSSPARPVATLASPAAAAFFASLALLLLVHLPAPGARAQAPAKPAAAAPASAAIPASLSVVAPATPTPTMPVEEVRIGMKGYGLTVFHGVKIEPFPVEVVSVMSDFAPQHPVIWIRCPDERMQKSGAVQGMSGSPIFLWDAGEPQVPGKGGRLIGAFAFGYGASLDCFVGVQPIAFMRDVGARMGPAADPANAKAAAESAVNDASPTARPALSDLLASPAVGALPASATWRARALNRLVEPVRPAASSSSSSGAAPLSASAAPPAPASPAAFAPRADRAQRLMLPVAIGSPRTSALIEPLLTPMGLMPLADRPAGAGRFAPPGIDPAAIRLQPGSVLSIPLAWGDADLSAAGTVTDVLPDGRVLGFGHAMFGQGPIAVPMATGFVHTVMPSRAVSFKLANSALIHGSILRDEQSAVAGQLVRRFTSAPVRLRINLPGQKAAAFQYNLVHLKNLTPILAAVVTIESLTNTQNLPLENTARLHGQMTFAGDRVVPIDLLVPDMSPEAALMHVMPPIAIMTQNPHESMPLQSMDLQIDVEPVLRVGSIVSARLDRKEVAPGQDASLSVRIQPYGKPAFERRLAINVPQSTPDGDYPLMVCDAQNYVQNLMQSRPHLMSPTNGADLHAMVQKILSIPSDSIFLVLQLRQDGLVVGQQELPRLPSSRRALIDSPTNTLATTYTQPIEASAPLGMIAEGNLSFTLSVRRKLSQ